MHVAHEILAERYEEQYADDASEQRGHEYLDERRAQLGILGLQDVDGRQGKDGPCDDSPRAGSDALYDDVLAQGLAPLGRSGHAHGNDCYGDGGLEHLPYLQSEVCGSGREEHGHEHSPRHRPAVDLGIAFPRVHHRLILLAFFQLPESVLGQLQSFVFVIFH